MSIKQISKKLETVTECKSSIIRKSYLQYTVFMTMHSFLIHLNTSNTIVKTFSISSDSSIVSITQSGPKKKNVHGSM